MTNGNRPQRLVPTAVAAFKAARSIPWGVKAVWVEDWILDRGPEASWISATNLAARLGMSKDNVERHRRWLLSLGFYHVVRRDGAKSDGWVPTLPLGGRHHGTAPADIQNTAARIDGLLKGTVIPMEGGVVGSATSGAVRSATRGGAHSATHGVPRAATPARGASLTQHSSEGQPLTPSTDRTREGASAPELQEEGPCLSPSERLALARRDGEESKAVEDAGWAAITAKLAEKRRLRGSA